MTKLVEQFKTQLQNHDWTYSYSDDHKAYMKGQEERDALYATKAQLESDGMTQEETVAIWNENCHSMFQLNLSK